MESEVQHIRIFSHTESKTALLGAGEESMTLAGPSCPHGFLEEEALFPPHHLYRENLKGYVRVLTRAGRGSLRSLALGAELSSSQGLAATGRTQRGKR